jgi:hypothetical protein
MQMFFGVMYSLRVTSKTSCSCVNAAAFCSPMIFYKYITLQMKIATIFIYLFNKYIQVQGLDKVHYWHLDKDLYKDNWWNLLGRCT